MYFAVQDTCVPFMLRVSFQDFSVTLQIMKIFCVFLAQKLVTLPLTHAQNEAAFPQTTA